MGYYIRVLGIQDPDIHIDDLISALKAEHLSAKFEHNASEQPGKWTMLTINNDDGEPLAQLERNAVVDGELGKEEMDEFREEIKDALPESSAKWLAKYFDKVKVIYAFQMLTASFEEGNFEIISTIRETIWNKTGGILQSDNEGFSNEDGYHILWQFANDVTGEWNCAVRNWLGHWEKFTMDLGDAQQRQEFQHGKVPKHATRL